jgi:hypothetical protein
MDHLCVIHPFLLGLNQSANGLLATFERPFLAESTHSATKIGLDDPNAYFRPIPVF